MCQGSKITIQKLVSYQWDILRVQVQLKHFQPGKDNQRHNPDTQMMNLRLNIDLEKYDVFQHSYHKSIIVPQIMILWRLNTYSTTNKNFFVKKGDFCGNTLQTNL